MSPRPSGVMVLAVLEFLIGVFGLAAGSLFALGGSVLGGVLGVFVSALGVITLIIGLISFAIGYGLWTAKSWGWTLAFILAIIGAVVNAVGIIVTGLSGIISLVVDLIVLYYLTRPHVKAYFGKGRTSSVAPSPPVA